MKPIHTSIIICCFLCQSMIAQEQQTEDKYPVVEKRSRIDTTLLMMCHGTSWLHTLDTPVDDTFDDLVFIAETNKKEYAIGEPIGIRLYIKNQSDESRNICHVNGYRMSDFIADLVEVKAWGQVVPFTRYGLPRNTYVSKPSSFYSLKPGEKFLLYDEFHDYRDCLNLYYDLSIRGVYELQFQRRYIDGDIAKFPKPCSITFEIVPNIHIPSQIIWNEPEQ